MSEKNLVLSMQCNETMEDGLETLPTIITMMCKFATFFSTAVAWSTASNNCDSN